MGEDGPTTTLTLNDQMKLRSKRKLVKNYNTDISRIRTQIKANSHFNIKK